mgnify:CR=1 FL=1
MNTSCSSDAVLRFQSKKRCTPIVTSEAGFWCKKSQKTICVHELAHVNHGVYSQPLLTVVSTGLRHQENQDNQVICKQK